MSAYTPDPSNPTNFFGGTLGRIYEYFRNGLFAVKLQSTTLTANRTISLPDVSGTLAVLGATQTDAGAKTFSGDVSIAKPIFYGSVGAAAAGTTTTDATVLGIAYYTDIVTAADGVKGVRLAAIGTGAEKKVINNGTGSLLLYPPTGGTINGAAANIPIIIQPNRAVLLQQISSTAWTALYFSTFKLHTSAAAAGSTTTDATVLTTTSQAIVITGADATKGVRLADLAVDAEIKVINNAAAVLKIYPPTGGTINGGAADAPISVSANRTALLQEIAALTWTALFN